MGFITRCALLLLAVTAVAAVNTSLPELQQRQSYPETDLHFTYPASSVFSTSAAGTTYSMDLLTNPILASLPSPGISSKIDVFAPCSIKIPHVHPRATKFSYVVSGTLAVGIGQEENAAQPVLNYNVTTGSSIVIPQGLLHYMKNMDCTEELIMLTVFNNVDPGEVTMIDHILDFPMDTIMGATGLSQAGVEQLQAGLPRGPGDLRVNMACQAACAGSTDVAPSVPLAPESDIPFTATAGK